MAIKDAPAEITLEVVPCRHCGHPHTQVETRPTPGGRLWLAYCPACRRVQDQAAIPESFLKGLLAPQGRWMFH